MKRTPVSSRMLRSVGYDRRTSTLELEFTSGKLYQYFDVPEAVHVELMNAPSLGGYFNGRIRGAYRWVEVVRAHAERVEV